MECPGEVIYPKLGKVCYIIKSLKKIMIPHVIRSIYYVNFHALLMYGITC